MKRGLKGLFLLIVILQLIIILTGCDLDEGPYILNINTSGAGRVKVFPDKPIYQRNERVYLRPEPYDSSWGFAYWEGSLRSDSTQPIVIMNSDKYINAVFGKESFYSDYNYNDGDSWYTGDYDDNSLLEIYNGEYAITIFDGPYSLGSIPGGVIPSGYTGDFYGEVEFRFDRQYARGGAGFVFNSSKDEGIRYCIIFDTNGGYFIEKIIDYGPSNLVKGWTETPYLHRYGINKIGIRKNGNHYSFYLNGYFLTDVYIRTVETNLGVAAFCRYYNTPITVYFDDFRVLLLDTGFIWMEKLNQDSEPVIISF